MVIVALLETARVDAAGRAALRAGLPPDELAAAARMADPHTYLCARWLVRASLSHGLPLPLAEWSFARTEAGKPFVNGPPSAVSAAVPLHFNLTHTDGLVACVVGAREVGIDAEPLARGPDIFATVRRAFAPREIGDLSPRRAVELWTVKEAYLKGLGTGISRHLDRFVVVPHGEERWRAEENPGWCMHTRLVGDRWLVATAVGAADPIAYRDVLPA